MKKSKLLTIGLLSKITNASIKSLRYYEQIGILPPVYTDPETGYRYYSFSQIHIVDAIQLCLELDIALKTFGTFLSKDKTHIYYNRLIEYGSASVEQKLKKLNERISLLKTVQQEIERSEYCLRKGTHQKYFLPEKYYLVCPYSGDRNVPAYNKSLTNLMMQISDDDWQRGYETGLLVIWQNGQAEQFIYAEILTQNENIPALPENILYLPAADYVCKTFKESSIRHATDIFPELLNAKSNGYILETELFTGDFNFSTPTYELRCTGI